MVKIMTIKITGKNLNIHEFIQVVRFHKQVELTKEAKEKVNLARSRIVKIIEENKTVYGVNTGFGKLCDVPISKNELSKLQENLLKSHACGVGDYFDEEVVRGIMLLRVNALAKGFSGIRLEVIEQLILYLNKNIIPAIPEKGSLGASGDLAPLSHMALTLIGLGEVFYHNKIMKTEEALKEEGITPIPHLLAKEGLSLINGTQAMTSVGAITLYDAIQLVKLADVSGSLTLEALFGIRDAFDESLHLARGQIGQIVSARNIRKLTDNSTYLTNQGEINVQDAYSLRCMAQVHGAGRDALDFILEKVEIEMNAATDNPLIFDDMVRSGGNFHGEPVALPFDFMKIAISELANISERRIERLVNPQLNMGLPPFLVAHPGINSGFMIVQYSAAALVSENKVLAHPASVDSIPSSGNQEDHVSMGTISARQAREILRNAQQVIALELFTATQALDLRDKKTLGKGTEIAYNYMRSKIPFIEDDTVMSPYLKIANSIVQSNELVYLIENKIDLGGKENE